MLARAWLLTEVRQLTDNGAPDLDPAWSPDGNSIAFYGHRNGDSEIFVMDADGTEVRQLTNNNHDDWGPTWSPGGEFIAFASDRFGKSESFYDNAEIFVMNADGTGVYSTGQQGVPSDWSGPAN